MESTVRNAILSQVNEVIFSNDAFCFLESSDEGIEHTDDMVSVNSAESPGVINHPLSSLTIASTAPTGVASTAKPLAIASIITLGMPSE